MKKETKNKSRSKNNQFVKLVNKPVFSRWYLAFSLATLLATVLYWTVQSAKVQLGNADTLASPFLFKTVQILHGAVFPGQHTFLLKWPLFVLISLFNYRDDAYIWATLLLVLATIFGLVIILWKIEPRKPILGTIYLGLSLVLLLVPAQPYTGALLPLNMAMLTTRNIEYLFFIISLILLSRTTRIGNWHFWAACILLTSLNASDKLFIAIGWGGAAMALIVYSLLRRWSLASIAARWLLAELIAVVGALMVLSGINASHLAHISGYANSGPYVLGGFHDFVLGILFGIMGIFTNTGANPAYDSTIVRDLPHAAISRLTSLGGPAFILNILILIFGLYAAWQLLYKSLKSNRGTRNISVPITTQLALMLVWSSAASFVLFVISKHYYAVDSRYLSIFLFAVFISLAVYMRSQKWRAEQSVGVGIILLFATVLGLVNVSQQYNKEQVALKSVKQRNTGVSQIIKNHPVNVLVGDYWRVLPIRQTSHSNVIVEPLQNCTQPRADLSSSAWQPDLKKHSFAYLLSYDFKLTDYPNCSLKQVVDTFGRPNTSVLVAGTLAAPKEQLLFYDRGIHKSDPITPQPAAGPSTVVPITTDQLPYTNCPGPSILAIVAHQDDDLLFMNPDISNAIKNGYCVRTVYLTAGDAGNNQYYWLSRESGSEAAYSTMLGDQNNIWVNRIVKLADNQYASVANPRGNSKVSLIFLHLPDGNLKGQGFRSSNFQSLAKLVAGKIPSISSIDNSSSYSYNQLTATLAFLMDTYAPTEIFTQSAYNDTKYQDHSDHDSASQIAKQAYNQYEKTHFDNLVILPIHYYMGYPTHSLPANVSDGDLQTKIDIFLNYGKHDGGVCHSDAACRSNQAYGAYLSREYTNPN